MKAWPALFKSLKEALFLARGNVEHLEMLQKYLLVSQKAMLLLIIIVNSAPLPLNETESPPPFSAPMGEGTKVGPVGTIAMILIAVCSLRDTRSLLLQSA